MTVKKAPGKTAKTKPQKIEVVLKIQSVHPSLPAPVAAERVTESISELASQLRGKYSGVRVKVERRKTFPFDPVTILVTVGIFVGTHIAGKALDAVIDTTVKWAKGKLKGARVTKADATPAPVSKPAKGRN